MASLQKARCPLHSTLLPQRQSRFVQALVDHFAAMGGVLLIAGYLIAWLAGGIGPARFARARIPAQAVARIFEPFLQAPDQDGPNTRRHLGLGLYIVKEIITAHGGDIQVTSSEAAGTTFRVSLPRGAPEHETVAQAVAGADFAFVAPSFMTVPYRSRTALTPTVFVYRLA